MEFFSLVITGRRGRQCAALTLRKKREPWAEPQKKGSLKSAVERQNAVLGGSEVPVPGGVQEEGGDVLAGILQKISKLQFWVGREEPVDLGGSFQRWEPGSWWITGK